jgi:hypothetical protein
MFYSVVVTLNAYATLWRYRMDFIEKIFGFSPDAGSGAFEVLVFVIPIIGLYLLYQRRSSSLGGCREEHRPELNSAH